MTVAQALTPIIQLASLVAIGYLVATFRIITPQGNAEISSFVYWIALPAMLLMSLVSNFSPQLLRDSLRMILSGVLLAAIGLTSGHMITRLCKPTDAQAVSMELGTTVGNYGFLGLPVCIAILGGEAAAPAIMIGIGSTLFCYTVGFWVLAGRQAWLRANWKSLIPLVASLGVGIVAGLLNWDLPKAISAVTYDLATAVTPLMMISLGVSLQSSMRRERIDRQLVVPVVVTRLILLPVLVGLISAILLLPRLLKCVLMFQAATPSGVTNLILSQQFEGDVGLMTRIIVTSTVLFVFTLPMWLAVSGLVKL